MKKIIIILAALSASLVSCNKTTAETPEVKSGIPMSVSVSFADLTKTTVVPDGDALKCTWDAEESISIITLDALSKGKVVAIDNFTSSGAAGRSSAKFAGRFTGGANPVKVILVYPALEKVGDTYRTKPHQSLYSGGTSSVLSDIKIGKATLKAKVGYPFVQGADNDCSHFQDFCVMVGNADLSKIKSGKLSASLRNLMTVFEIRINFNRIDNGKKLTKLQFGNTFDFPLFLHESTAYVDLDASKFSEGSDIITKKNISIPANFKVPDPSGYVRMYVPCVPCAASTAMIDFHFTLDGAVKAVYRDLKSRNFEAGKMYTAGYLYP